MFQMGYHWDRYMTKEEAGEALDRRDADPLYRHFVRVLVPLGLQHFKGPDATLSSWDLLHKIYPDKPRSGGIDPRLVYNGDPQAALKVMRTCGPAARRTAAAACPCASLVVKRVQRRVPRLTSRGVTVGGGAAHDWSA